MRNMRIGLVVAAVLVWVATAFGAESARWMGAPLRLGAVGYAGSGVEASVRALGGYLADGLHAKVEVTFYPKYEEILTALEAGKLEVAILPPVLFLMAREKAGVQPIANPVYQSGETNYRSVLLSSRSRRDIGQLSDLAGKRVAFVDQLSASGFVVPRGLLGQAGVKDVKEVFTGNHVKSMEALAKGEVDAAATYDMLLSQTPSLGKTLEDFTVLARSDPIPGDVLVGRKDMPGGQLLWIRGMLLNFGKRRVTDKSLSSCLYQWFFGYDASRYEPLAALWKRTR